LSDSGRRLILASGSPRRRELLAAMGWTFLVRPVELDESPFPGEDAAAYVGRLALAKARAAAEQAAAEAPDALVLGADTVVALEGELFGKPQDPADARRMLRRLSGRRHQVLTGVALLDGEREWLEVARTAVEIAPLSEQEIELYVATGEPLDKAGAYAVQGRGALFVSALEGNYSNVVGLPLPVVYRLLLAAGGPGPFEP
jgi:septum formation protein